MDPHTAHESSQPFSWTLRSLREDSSYRIPLMLLGAAILLGIWLGWFVRARVPVFVISDEARLEFGGSRYRMTAPLDGTLAAVHVVVGEDVEAGQTLVALDAGIEQADLREAEARLRSALNQLAVRRAEREELATALERAAEAAGFELREAGARRRGSEAAAAAAEAEARRAAELHSGNLISDQEIEQALAAAERTRSEAEELALAEERARVEWERDFRDRRAALSALEREIVELEGLLESSAAAVERYRETVQKHVLRSPVSGTVAEVTRVGTGANVTSGDPLVTVVPHEGARAVAQFAPSAAIGRVEPGQKAEIRLAGFPWTEFGVLEAEVRSVAGELRDDKVTVVLDLIAREDDRIPIRHGLPGTIAVQVGEVSPAGLLFRSLGGPFSPSREDPDP